MLAADARAAPKAGTGLQFKRITRKYGVLTRILAGELKVDQGTTGFRDGQNFGGGVEVQGRAAFQVGNIDTVVNREPGDVEVALSRSVSIERGYGCLDVPVCVRPKV